MPSITRTILIVFHATAFITLIQAAICVDAAPLSRSMTISMRPAILPRNFSRPPFRSMRIARNVTSLSVPPSPAQALSIEEEPVPSDAEHSPTFAGPFAEFSNFYLAAKQNSKNLKKLAAQSASKANDVTFQNKCAAQLNAFHSNIAGQQAALSAIEDERLKTGNGLANYDDKVAIEKLLKDSVNLVKETLTATDVLVKKIPILGPLLGPIMDATKCLLEAILDSSEELVDGTLNNLPPFLKNLLLPLGL